MGERQDLSAVNRGMAPKRKILLSTGFNRTERPSAIDIDLVRTDRCLIVGQITRIPLLIKIRFSSLASYA
jgi:hypothetical protein